MNSWPSTIVHADMDAFYAAVEQLDDPSLRGRAVLVGPNSSRGIVLTASYEARRFGVGSAMPIAEARRRCPEALIVPPRMSRYAQISQQVMDVLGDFSPAVEPLSLDEAFVDMSGAEHLFGAPDSIGRRIKAAVHDATGLTISVGISGTKYVAKVASAFGKPDGLIVVDPSKAIEWLAPLPVSWLWGAGQKTAAKLRRLGFDTIGDIARASPQALKRSLGDLGTRFHELAHAKDPRRVSRYRTARSIGSERTLSQDIQRREDIERHLRSAADRVARRLRKKNFVAGGIRVRLKTANFDLLTRQRRLPQPDDSGDAFYAVACRLLDQFDHPGPFRLVGIAAYDLDWRSKPAQNDLFEHRRPRNLDKTIDALIDKFGDGVVVRAIDLAGSGTVHEGGADLDFLDCRRPEPAAKDSGHQSRK